MECVKDIPYSVLNRCSGRPSLLPVLTVNVPSEFDDTHEVPFAKHVFRTEAVLPASAAVASAHLFVCGLSELDRKSRGKL